MKILSVFILILGAFVVLSCGSDGPKSVSERIHAASRSIESSANQQAITESLYKQMRPRANVTNTGLTPKEIDRRVFKYISEKYTPVLIQNYQQIYSSLVEAKKDFTDCHSPDPITNDDVLQSLCLNPEEAFIEIKYLTNAYSQGWKTAAIFKFAEAAGKFELVEIDIQLSGDQKVYVEGI